MDDPNKELAAEQAALQAPKEEEVRADIISDFGFDESVDGDKIDKLVEKEMSHRKKLSSAIGQKIKFRTEAEKNKQPIPPPNTSTEKGDLSSKEVYALMNAKVSEEDIDEVVEYARFKKITVGDALKTSTVKTMLSEKAEMRNTANAANTSPARRSNTQPKGEELLEAASKGKVPDEASDADLERLAEARMNAKKNKK